MTEPDPALDAIAPAPARRRASDRWTARPPRISGAMVVLAVLAVAGFGALAVWLGSATPPQVTHAEAMQVAAAIEQARDEAGLEPLFDVPEVFPDAEQRITRLIANAKRTAQKRETPYTFIEVHLDDQNRRSLLFRLHTSYLLEYHELRLGRRGEAVKVTDAWSALFDGWYSDLSRELDQSEHRQLACDFIHRLTAKEDPEQLAAAWRAMPPLVRNARAVAMTWLLHACIHRLPDLPAMLAAFVAGHPDHLGPALLQLCAPDTSPKDRLAAIDRIAARVSDAKFLDKLREQVPR
jgi:hypothetical protein